MTETEPDPRPDSESAEDQAVEMPKAGSVEPETETPAETPPSDPVRRWTIVLLVVALGLIAWYLAADRATPFTSQARLTAIVIPIAPQVSGIVQTVSVRENQPVDREDLLLTIDPANYELARRTAEADLESARQATGASEASVFAAEAGVAAAEAALRQADQDATRLQRIKQEDPGAISDRRLQIAIASLGVAEANLEASHANLAKAREDLGKTGDQNVRILKAQAALEKAELDLARTEVRAPESGLVTGVKVDQGNFAAAGAPLMTFVGIDNVWVQADFTENNLGHIEAGDPVEIVFDALPGRIVTGTVRSIGFGVNVDSAPLGSLPTIDNDRSWLRDAQRFPVVVDFEAPDGSSRVLKVGSQASVTVYTETRPVLNALARFRMRLEALLTYAY